MSTRFADRDDAGRRLGDALAERPGVVGGSAVVLGLPRGGVVVAARVAERLGARLDVVGVRKLGTPGRPELAMGAVAVWGGHVATIRNEHVITGAGVSDEMFAGARAAELTMARRRAAGWGQQGAEMGGGCVVLVDDGIATGATIRAAATALRGTGAARLVAAVPVAPAAELAVLRDYVDDIVCLVTAVDFGSVGAYYKNFEQTTDAAVVAELAAARRRFG